MNKRTLILLAVLMVALLFVSFSTVLAKPDKPGSIDCVLDITFKEHTPGNWHWLGTISGPECTVAGTIEFYAVPEEYFTSGKTIHFVETFIIRPDGGGEIHGKNYGVWNLSTFKFRANGWVKDASPEWAHLVGYKYHEMGVTSTDTSNTPPDPIYAPDGWAKLVPANRKNAP